MFDVTQTIKEHIAYNEGYSKGQEDAHRYYHMMLTGKQESIPLGGNVEDLQGRLGEYSNDGYSLEKYPDTTIVVWFKESMIAALPEVAATAERIQGICERHQVRLREPAEVNQ